MKITILQGAFLPVPPLLGGAVEKMWFALSKEFVKLGHDVTYISRSYPGMPEEEWIEGVFHKRIKGYQTPSSGLYLKLLDLLYTLRARRVIRLDADVVITNTFWAPILLPSALKRRCVPDVARMPKGQIPLYNKASLLRANSSPVATAIKKELKGKNLHRVFTVPNPLPFSDLPYIDLKRKKRIILYTGRIHPEKGLELLIKSFNATQQGWLLRIVGPWQTEAGGGGDAYFRSLKELAQGLEVDFTGPIYNADQLNTYYANAAIFVYPSIAEKGETFGLAPLEAMAWGCAPIVSALPCFQDFIEHGTNGLTFNHRSSNAVKLLSQAIAYLQKDSDILSELAMKALEVRKSHSVSFIASQFLEQFSKISMEKNTYNTPTI